MNNDTFSDIGTFAGLAALPDRDFVFDFLSPVAAETDTNM
jgi:hypothetical protein